MHGLNGKLNHSTSGQKNVHVHTYERMHGIGLDGKLNHAAPMYITVGDGGNHERLYPDWVSPLPATSMLNEHSPLDSAYHDGHFYGHGELKVFNKTHILWSWVPNPAQVGELPYDSYWIAPRGEAFGSKKIYPLGKAFGSKKVYPVGRSGKAFGSKKIHPVGMPLSFVLLYAIPVQP
ncbi:hypothetical protein T484DRAFT_1813585 [Baffinella frigidus]|nr:hypothetical protein T484DRAFT_1813585 [Cryptophyta sp. CCMP2293]